MASSYYSQREETADLATALMNRGGWKVEGFKEDESDSMTDYWNPEHWIGEAVFLATGATLYTRFSRSGKVPAGKSWALYDRDDKRIACGANVKRSGCSTGRTAVKIRNQMLAEKIETAAGRPPRQSAARLLPLAAIGVDLWSVRAEIEGYGANEYTRRTATPAKLAEIARIEALTARYYGARTWGGTTERDRKETAASFAREAGNKIFEAIDRQLAGILKTHRASKLAMV